MNAVSGEHLGNMQIRRAAGGAASNLGLLPARGLGGNSKLPWIPEQSVTRAKIPRMLDEWRRGRRKFVRMSPEANGRRPMALQAMQGISARPSAATNRENLAPARFVRRAV